MNRKLNYQYDNMEDDTLESTEKLVTADCGGKFEIILDIVKVNTGMIIEEYQREG